MTQAGSEIVALVLGHGLVCACLIYAGSLGIAAAVARANWKWRVSAVILLLSPPLFFQAAELFWCLALLVGLVATGVTLANHWRVRKSNSAGEGDGAVSTKRFSLVTMLFGTALAAGAFMIFRSTPPLNFAAWSSLALVAVVSSLCVLTAWAVTQAGWRWWIKGPTALVAVLLLTIPLVCFDWSLGALAWYGWPPDVKFAASGLNSLTMFSWFAVTVGMFIYVCVVLHLAQSSQAKNSWNRILLVATIAPILASLGSVAFQLSTPPSLPEVGPAGLAFDRAVKLWEPFDASSLSAHLTTYGDVESIPAQLRQSSLNEMSDELDELEALLHQPMVVNLTKGWEELDRVMGSRDAARALTARGICRLAAKQPDQAMQAFLSTIRLGIKARSGGVILSDLIGRSATSTGAAGLYRNRHAVTNATRQQLARDLGQLIEQLEPIAAFFKRDRIWSQTLGWHSQLQFIIGDITGTADSFTLDFYQKLRDTEIAELRLLIVELALSSYAADHGGHPESLAALVPDYLPAVPADPLAPDGRALTYVPQEKGYQLYSLGQNGVDDGGAPIPQDPATGMVDRSVGDYSLEHVYAD